MGTAPSGPHGALKPERLGERLVRRIRTEGPISVAAFMAAALHDPVGGYYARQNPLGREGDFVTAPEISQIFGELIGVWCADLWQRMGSPDPVELVEFGPGRGTLLADLLRAAATVPAFRRALRLSLVETSPVLRAVQQERLAAAEPRFLCDAAELPDGPLIIIANEFFDALPVRQLVRGEADWAEILVAADAGGGLAFAAGRESPVLSALVPPLLRGSPPGTIFEIGPAAAALAASLGERLTRWPGAALLIDYGYFPSAAGATLAALRRHRPVAILDEPGTADLSAHVDFAAIAAAAKAGSAAVHGPVAQGEWLRALGAEARLAALMARAAPAQRAVLEGGVRRLIDPAQMGTLFKVMALTSRGLPVPAGFATGSDGQ